MQNRERRGNIIVAALLLVVAVGFAALVIDVGYTRTVHYQLQNASDAAAHAGAAYLDTTSAGVTSARNAAIAVGGVNTANGNAVTLTTSDIEFGDWDGGTFTTTNNAADIDAIRVTARLTNMNAFFSRVAFNQDSLSASARSIAMMAPPSPPSAVDCFIPIAIPLCSLQRYATGTIPSITFEFSSAIVDNAGWADLFTNPSASTVRDQLNNCNHSGEATVGDTVYLNNGEVTNGLQNLATAIENSTTRWDSTALGTIPTRMTSSAVRAAYYGHTFEGPVPVFDQGNQDCNDINFVHSYPIAGFAWGVIFDVRATGSNKNVKLRINNTLEEDFGTAGGGTVDAGVIYRPPPMVVQ